jgi:hypothetical protein
VATFRSNQEVTYTIPVRQIVVFIQHRAYHNGDLVLRVFYTVHGLLYRLGAHGQNGG